MSFDWISLFNQHRIEYVTSGPNISKGHIAIKCPWCAAADPSQHMSIALSGMGWRCFRNREHRGIQPTRLIQVLLNCSYEHARSLVYGESQFLPNDFLAKVNGSLRPQIFPAKKKELKLLPEFLSFKDLPSAKPFIHYLNKRGYKREVVLHLTSWYGLRYCTRGHFEHRIIFPVQFQNNLVSWIGRSIAPQALVRYKTLSVDPDPDSGLPPAIGPVSDYLLWYDKIREVSADTIVLCEGPFDALRVNVLGRKYGVVGTCFFTSRPSRFQIELLHEILPRYKRRFLLLDQDMTAGALRVASDLSALGVDVVHLPSRRKDPAELDVGEFIRTVVRRTVDS
jgi:hypothetical protein